MSKEDANKVHALEEVQEFSAKGIFITNVPIGPGQTGCATSAERSKSLRLEAEVRMLASSGSPNPTIRSSPALTFCLSRLLGKRPPDPAYPKQIDTIGDHIRKRRLDLGITQKLVGAQIGVTVDTIANCEGQRSYPALPHMPAIIRFIGYNPFSEADTLAGRLARYRTSRGISQKTLAKTLGLPVHARVLGAGGPEAEPAVPRTRRKVAYGNQVEPGSTSRGIHTQKSAHRGAVRTPADQGQDRRRRPGHLSARE